MGSSCGTLVGVLVGMGVNVGVLEAVGDGPGVPVLVTVGMAVLVGGTVAVGAVVFVAVGKSATAVAASVGNEAGVVACGLLLLSPGPWQLASNMVKRSNAQLSAKGKRLTDE